MNKKNDSLTSYEKAVKKLKEFLDEPIMNDRDKAGIILAFEYCFELSWKVIQKKVASHNKTVGSSKQAFQAAFELGWIKADLNSSGVDLWTSMVNDRNLTYHTYQEEIANEVLTRIQSDHYPLFVELLDVLKKH